MLSKPQKCLETSMLMLSLILEVFCILAPLHAQDETPLGDVARKTRAAHAASPVAPTAAAATASHWASEVRQEQEVVGSTPDGFGTYVGPGYKLWVPAPFSAVGRNDLGTLLGISETTGLTTKVFVGNPVHMPRRLNDLEFNAWASEFWQPYGALNCFHVKPGTAYHDCSARADLLGYFGDGIARFVENGDEVLPVVCFSRDEYEVIDISRRPKREDLQAKAPTSRKICATVLDSIQVRNTAENFETPHPIAHATPALVSPLTGPQAEPNLAQIARASKAKAHAENVKFSMQEQDPGGKAPVGFGDHSSDLCLEQCWEESFYLPEGVRRVQGGKSDDVYVATCGDRTLAIFYFAISSAQPLDSEMPDSRALAREWIHARVDYRLPAEHSNQTINGHDAIVVRTRLLTKLDPWIEYQAIINTNGFHKMIGCMFPEAHFTDHEPTCLTVFESWEVHP
jgi:hypothetical protein